MLISENAYSLTSFLVLEGVQSTLGLPTDANAAIWMGEGSGTLEFH